jgi:dihydropyrimidine dehydrogenase (NAD+) subunit PreA
VANLKVKAGGVTFPIRYCGFCITFHGLDRHKKGIEGGAGGVIVKSLFGEKGKLAGNFPRPRFKLYDYKTILAIPTRFRMPLP